MLHNSIPHSHDHGATQSEKFNSNDGFDFLNMLSSCFQFDLGEDHLENFSRTDHQMPHFDYLTFLFDGAPIFAGCSSQVVCDNQNADVAFSSNSSFYQRVYYLSSLALRAPPISV